MTEGLNEDGAGALRGECHHAVTVLDNVAVTIPSPTTPSCPERRGLFNPDVEHLVKMDIRRANLIVANHLRFGTAQIREDFPEASEVFFAEGANIGFGVGRAEDEVNLLRFARLQYNVKLRRGYCGICRTRRVGTIAPNESLRILQGVVEANKCVASSIKSHDRRIGSQETGQMIVRTPMGMFRRHHRIVFFREKRRAKNHVAIAVEPPLEFELELIVAKN